MSALTKLVHDKFEDARKNNDIFFFKSTVTKRMATGVEFDITFVPSLSNKPSSHNGSSKEKKNPFLEPEPALVVQELESHCILLNKFCVVPRHILVVTKEFREQKEPLSPEDLQVTWTAMTTAYGSTSAMAFFNCGDQSGASQSHKHLQIIPLEGTGAQPPIVSLFDAIKGRKTGEIYTMALPFINVVLPLDRNVIDSCKDKDELADCLLKMFLGLLDEMFQQLRSSSAPPHISYNFIMTEQFMMVVPRSQETVAIKKDVVVSVNSLGFAGMLLAKVDEERDALEEHPNLLDVLAQAGVQYAH